MKVLIDIPDDEAIFGMKVLKSLSHPPLFTIYDKSEKADMK